MALTASEVEKFYKSHGYARTVKNSLHLYKEVDGRVCRIEISKVAVRKCVKVIHPATRYSPQSVQWVRLRSGYLKNLAVTDGKLVGLSTRGC